MDTIKTRNLLFFTNDNVDSLYKNGEINFKFLHSSALHIKQFQDKDSNYQTNFNFGKSTTWCNYVISPNRQGFVHKKQFTIPPQIWKKQKYQQETAYSGLFEELGLIWIAVGSDLCLWNYENGNQVKEYTGFDTDIVSVGFVSPKEGLAEEEIQNVIVVATLKKICLMSLVFPSSTKESLRLYPLDFQTNLNGVLIRDIKGTIDGRIFLAGHDGNLYEFEYNTESSFFKKKCSLVNRTNFSINNISGVLQFFSKSPIIQIAIDNSRRILYTLSENSTIQVFDVLGNECKFICQNDDYQKDIENKLLYSQTDQGFSLLQEEFEILKIYPILNTESSLVTLIAITNFGDRFYFTTFPGKYSVMVYNNERPSTLNLIHIRFFLRKFRNHKNLQQYIKKKLQVMFLENNYNDGSYSGSESESDDDDDDSEDDSEDDYDEKDSDEISNRQRIRKRKLNSNKRKRKNGKKKKKKKARKNENFEDDLVINNVFYKNGVFLIVDSNQENFDQILSTNVQFQSSQRSSIQKEAITPIGIKGNILYIKETPIQSNCMNSVLSELLIIQEEEEQERYENELFKKQEQLKKSSNNKERIFSITTSKIHAPFSTFIRNELASQHLFPAREFLCLTTQGLDLVMKLRPIDELALIISKKTDQKSKRSQISRFITEYGHSETCAMCLLIITFLDWGYAEKHYLPKTLNFVPIQKLDYYGQISQNFSPYGNESSILYTPQILKKNKFNNNDSEDSDDSDGGDNVSFFRNNYPQTTIKKKKKKNLNNLLFQKTFSEKKSKFNNYNSFLRINDDDDIYDSEEDDDNNDNDYYSNNNNHDNRFKSIKFPKNSIELNKEKSKKNKKKQLFQIQKLEKFKNRRIKNDKKYKLEINEFNRNYFAIPANPKKVYQYAKWIFFEFGGEPHLKTTKKNQIKKNKRKKNQRNISFSNKHDGFCLFLSRLLLPIWNFSVAIEMEVLSNNFEKNNKNINKNNNDDDDDDDDDENVNNNDDDDENNNEDEDQENKGILSTVKESIIGLNWFAKSKTVKKKEIYCRYSKEQLIELQKPLEILKHFLLTQEMLSKFLKEPKKINFQYKTKKSSIDYDVKTKEEQSIRNIFYILCRSLEALKFLEILVENKFEKIVGNIENKNIINELKNLSFEQLVTTYQGLKISQTLITSLFELCDQTSEYLEQLSDLFEYHCPSFFSSKDRKRFEAYEFLSKAKLTKNNFERMQILKQSLALFQKISDKVNIKVICKEFAKLKFFKGAFNLALTKASIIEKKEMDLNNYNNNNNSSSSFNFKFNNGNDQDNDDDEDFESSFLNKKKRKEIKKRLEQEKLDTYQIIIDIFDKFLIDPLEINDLELTNNTIFQKNNFNDYSDKDFDNDDDDDDEYEDNNNNNFFGGGKFDDNYFNNINHKKNKETTKIFKKQNQLRNDLINYLIQSKDELFHNYFYNYLLNKKFHSILIEINSNCIEKFLIQNSHELLWQYYVNQKRFFDSAQVLIDLAEQKNQLPINERIDYFSFAIMNLKSSISTTQYSGETLKEIQEKLDVAIIQEQIYQELQELVFQSNDEDLKIKINNAKIQLELQLFTNTELFNQFAFQFQLYDSCFAIIHSSSFEDIDFIKQIWYRMVNQEITRMAEFNGGYDDEDDDDEQFDKKRIDPKILSWVKGKVKKIGLKYFPNSIVFPVDIIVDILEEANITYFEQEEWVVDLMLEINVPFGHIFKAYNMLLNSKKPIWNIESNVAYEVYNLNYLVNIWLQRIIQSKSRKQIQIYKNNQVSKIMKNILRMLNSFEQNNELEDLIFDLKRTIKLERLNIK
ncbi:nuclear pore complex protein nup155 [Anaeramoeba flamelloides]|uniref:Nuclear pore complex protein nup155 n=1 Tax=Anaeramoeba flamelloides TaxID=1746091 RepID=A0AAV7YVR2_9EUKA|nr:nuclear pore complex protein nup155 [Anaeramoeba flamelloides]